jgi:hypothetical protein
MIANQSERGENPQKGNRKSVNQKDVTIVNHLPK